MWNTFFTPVAAESGQDSEAHIQTCGKASLELVAVALSGGEHEGVLPGDPFAEAPVE